ncbi:ubiquinol-cytochrome C reductase UQCRX/QCR9-like protein [Cylindrobasidium torrendii FP15055 ss-10]|uniref:Complex III subunit 9 n=1 Tax=Cylindrobasidium torrendii FP15055 ss-10 TaxID=1314674 RepID=A0A0D7B5H8_9AGAR|nr:ubiquinol-cytochrome C reductase UQCRX/QCR9-like protein [Cylindrobasidium torrendii FP15055 ss-10]
MSLSNVFYNTIFKRNSTFVPAVFAGAFAWSIGFEIAVTKFHDSWNKGKQWKDIRDKYATVEE